MNRIFYIVLLLPLLTKSANPSMYHMLKKRQYGDDKTRLLAHNLEKERLLSSDGTEASPIVNINIQNALDYHKIMGIVIQANKSSNNIFLRIFKEYIQPESLRDMYPLLYINSADGLNTLPLRELESRRYLLSMSEKVTPQKKARVNAIQLQNTNIHTIYPYQLKNYPNLKIVVLPNTTPENLRKINSEKNPTITFQYAPMSRRFRTISP